MVRWTLFILLTLMVLTGSACAREPKHDPSTRMIRIIYLGDAWGPVSPIFEMYKDPMFRPTPVPASETHGRIEDMEKILRIYMPRIYSDLVNHYDIVVLSDTQAVFYTTKQLSWFKKGVESDGMGLIMVGGRDTQLGSWPGTSVEEALPADFIGLSTFESIPFRAIPVDPESEFIRALPFDKMPHYVGMNVVSTKQGATVILKSNQKDYPILVYHEFGEGASTFHTPDWTPLWGGEVYAWEYYGDFVSNMMYMLAGLSIPQDPALMHSLRMYFGDYEVKRGMILSLADFIDKFGANTAVLDREMGSVSESRAHVSGLYMDQEYESALSLIQELIEELDDIQNLALKLKDRAMLWIYITEVSAVTGMSLICGTALWFLMVKRKLYREVEITRPVRRR